MKSSLEKLQRAKALMAAYERPVIASVELPKKRTIEERLAYYACPHRSMETVTLEARPIACGCGQVVLHPCLHPDCLGELIIIRAPKNIINSKRLRGCVPSFTGRTCATCELWKG